VTRRLKLAVLISGRGSNLQALIDACALPDFPAVIDLVVSNEPQAAGLDRAREAGLDTAVINHRTFSSRAAFEQALDARLLDSGPDLICLAGFMRILGADFVRRWERRIINIHPSLLPALKGLDTHARALEAGLREHGCTVHYVTAELDDGPAILQAKVPVLPDDTVESLAARVLAEEHRIYPEAVRQLAEAAAVSRTTCQ